MIKIEIFRTEDGKISGYAVQGNNGEYGTDIVCAGISSVAQTALLGIGEHLHRDVDFHVASGDLRMKLKSEPDDLTEAILETMLLGFTEIAKVSPKAVRIFEYRR